MFYSFRCTHASMACSSLAPGRRAKPRVPRTEKSCGSTGLPVLSLEVELGQPPSRRLAPPEPLIVRGSHSTLRAAALAREISRPRLPPVPRVRVRCPSDL